METLFVYGTLRDPQVQTEIIGRKIRGTPDVLDGYERVQIQLIRHRYPAIRPCEDSCVSGLRLHVTPQELKQIDIYETSAYARIRVTLRSGQSTWVYLPSHA